MDTDYQCECRALENQGNEVRLSIEWRLVRRDELRLTSEALEWGSWSVPYEEIEDAMIYRYPLIYGYPFCAGRPATLVVWARGKNYHFQLPSISQFWYVIDPVWLGAMPFPLRFETESARSFRRNNRGVLILIGVVSVLGASLLFALVGRIFYG
jgi:hypothetical protein